MLSGQMEQQCFPALRSDAVRVHLCTYMYYQGSFGWVAAFASACD